MAEYTTDEERFSALVNFFKDNKVETRFMKARFKE